MLIGCGGIGSQLLPSLVRYLSFRPEPRPLLVLVDGDVFEPANRSRQLFPDDALGTNKAEALAQVFRGRWARRSRRSPSTSSADNVGLVVREGDVVLLAVDNHPTRALVDRHIADPLGRDAHQRRQRRDGRQRPARPPPRRLVSVDGHLVEIHPEIGEAADRRSCRAPAVRSSRPSGPSSS